jgi:D-amino peptidase
MRVYISVDLEGVAGIAHEEQTHPYRTDRAAEYAQAQRWMTQEANAAVRGALAAGATRVVVNDSHWHMRNLLADELHPAAELGSGSPKPGSMVDGIDGGFDAACFIGYHAKAGTAQAVIDHTYNDAIHDVRLNGLSVGEVGLNAAYAGSWGVPVVLVSGDQAVAAETRALLGTGVETVIVKESLGRQAARSVHPSVACERIEAGVQRALARAHTPWQPALPVTLEVELVTTHQADMAVLVPGVRRLAGRTVAFTAEQVPLAFATWRAVMNLATVP